MGTYGLVAYLVSLRRHEIGVRLALATTWLPATRAAQVDPAEVLRTEA